MTKHNVFTMSVNGTTGDQMFAFYCGCGFGADGYATQDECLDEWNAHRVRQIIAAKNRG